MEVVTPMEQPMAEEPVPMEQPNEAMPEMKANEYELHESLATPKQLEEDLSKTAPTAPGLLYTINGANYSMPIRHMKIRTECHYSKILRTRK